MDGLDCEHYAPTPGLDLVKGVLSCAVAAGKSSDNVAAVVDVRRAFFYAEPLPKTLELFDHFDIDTRTRCCKRLGTVLARNKTSCKVVGTIEKRIKAAGVIGKMSKCSSSLHAGIWWGSCTAMTSCSRDQDHLLMRCGILCENALRYVNRCWERDTKMEVR